MGIFLRNILGLLQCPSLEAYLKKVDYLAYQARGLRADLSVYH